MKSFLKVYISGAFNAVQVIPQVSYTMLELN